MKNIVFVSKIRASDRSVVANRLIELYFKYKGNSYVDLDDAKNCFDYFDIETDFDVTDEKNVKETMGLIRELLIV